MAKLEYNIDDNQFLAIKSHIKKSIVDYMKVLTVF